MGLNLIVFLLMFSFQTEADSPVKAPDFEFVLEDGSSRKLSDYKGQVVYISFWASWCTPCLSNFKKYKTIREQLDEMGIVLLNISIDKNKLAWDLAVDKNVTLNGVNGYATDIPHIQDTYSLSSIPVYEIVNKYGEQVYLSDSPNRNIISDFRTWLDE